VAVRPPARPGGTGPDNSEALLVILQMAVMLAVVAAVALDGLPYWNRPFLYLVALGLAGNLLTLAATFLGIAPDTVGPASTLANGVLAAAVHLATGGVRSPVTPVLMLALAGIAIRFPYRRALALGVGLIAAYVLTAALTVAVDEIGRLLVSACLDGLGLFIFCGLVGRAAAQRERFLRVAAHELRNPLAAIAAIVALLRRRVAGHRDPEETLRTVTTLEREVHRLSARVDEVVEAFRAREGGIPTVRERIDLAAVLAAAVRPFAEFDQSHPLTVEGLDTAPVWVAGDAQRLEQVLRNLLANAVKYTPDGGAITVALGVEGTDVRMTVRDRGIGIPARQISRVFEPFFRCDNVDGRDPGGLGLGLFICRDIVRRHGGRLWVESEEGRGSTFHLLLPVCNAAPVREGSLSGGRHAG